MSANISHSMNSYASALFVTTVLVGVIFFLIGIGMFSFFLPMLINFSDSFVFTVLVFLMSLLLGVLFGAVVFMIIYYYPLQRMNYRRKRINLDMSYALSYMASIAGSGVAPQVAFKMLAEIGEYGEVSAETKHIVRDLELMGKDLNSALVDAAKRTPSTQFAQILISIRGTLLAGGNFMIYLKEKAQEQMFAQQLRERQYTKTMELYSDFYTILVVAAPLFIVTMVLVMGLIGGSETLPIPAINAIQVLSYFLIPAINIMFLFVIKNEAESRGVVG